MSKTITCDICGKVYGYSTWQTKSRGETTHPIPNRIVLRNVNPNTEVYQSIESLDICHNCINKFSQWVDDQRREELKREAEVTE